MLTLEESFGALVRDLRVKADIEAQELPELLLQETGVAIHRNTLTSIELAKTERPRREVVRALVRFFYQRQALRTAEDITYFCLRAGYRVEGLEFVEKDLGLLGLVPLKGQGFREAVAFLLSSLVGAAADSSGDPLFPPLKQGLSALTDAIGSIAPGRRGSLGRIEDRVERFVRALRVDDAVGARLAANIERAFKQSRSHDERFRLAFLLSQVQERRSRYSEALEAAERAYFTAQVLASRRKGELGRAQEALAALCESLGAAALNIGTPEQWGKAAEFYTRALALREQLKQELKLEIEIAEGRDLEALFQLARVKTHRRQLAEAEASYLALLEHPLLRARPLLRAHILKELADNCRLADDQDKMRAYFAEALDAYQAVSPRHLVDDPAASIELHLNIGYCLRRLGKEEEAVTSLHAALDLSHARRDRRRVAYSCLQLARSTKLQATPREAAFYGLVACEIMRASAATADMEQAELLVDELASKITVDERTEMANDLRVGSFAVYLKA